MRKYIIPYAYKKDGNWSAVDIYNDNCDSNDITVTWLAHPDGTPLKSRTLNLYPYHSVVIDPSEFPNRDNGRYRIEVIGPDNLFVTHVYVGPWQMQTIEASS